MKTRIKPDLKSHLKKTKKKKLNFDYTDKA